MVALASDFDVLGTRFLTCLTTVLVTILRHASAWQVGTLLLFVGRHRHSPYLDRSIRSCRIDAVARLYLRFIIQPMNVPAVTPIANVVATVSRG
jgi:hypothetical protein